VQSLNYSTMDAIGIRAKELKKTMDEIISNLNKLNDTNYDKNKIDYLFEILEKSIES
jgi:predicted nucleotide-binding protein (sugar kinase/HSP70/actin superfamily)